MRACHLDPVQPDADRKLELNLNTALSPTSDQQIQRVYLLGPNFWTLGGFEAQIMLLATGLQARQIEVDVFIREPVRADHPYWQRMQAAGAHVHAPSRSRASLVLLPTRLYPACFRMLSVLLAPAML